MVCMLECLACGSRLSGLHDGSAAAGRQGGAAAPWAMTGSYPVRVIFHALVQVEPQQPSNVLNPKREVRFRKKNESLAPRTKCPGGPGRFQGLPPGGARARWCVTDGAFRILSRRPDNGLWGCTCMSTRDLSVKRIQSPELKQLSSIISPGHNNPKNSEYPHTHQGRHTQWWIGAQKQNLRILGSTS